MNKKNKILIGCLALLLVLSVGYALFSETVTINGTATAKGDFDITYTCSVITKDTAINDSFSIPKSSGSGSCIIENDIIKTTSTLNKPGDFVGYRVVLTNEGSIPAVLKTVNSSNNYNADMSGSGDYAYFDATYFLMAYYGFLQGEGNPYMGDSIVESAKLTLQPGETLDLAISHSWHNLDSNQPELPEEGATMNYNIVLGFEQVTSE